MTSLVTHVKDHGVSADYSEHYFSTFDEFLEWKRAEGESTCSCYVKHGGSIENASVRYGYFYCNRSGSFKGKGSGTRNVKVQNSSKIGATCVAHMKVEEDVKNGSCKVQYCATHCGHKTELAHMCIPECLRAKIATQLKEGVSVGKIMDSIRDVSLAEGVKREHLLVRQDVRNIERVLNLGNIQKHSNDQTSVALWVQEASKNQEYNPVLVFKPQGEENAVVGNTDDLARDTFLLGIQTEFQKDAMKKYGSNSVICVDATHGTNVYDFLLITVMVVDNYGEGIPVAWAISDREDACTLVQFFKPLYEQVGNIEPCIFMSDDAEQYYTAWCGVFGVTSKPKKLLCAWHVDRAWQKAIHEHVTGAEQKLEVYHMLQVLRMESSVTDFQVLLSQAISYFEKNCPRFCEYMRSTYATRAAQWATCHRMHTQIDTNMVVEAFHRVLKIVYLEHKQNRRIDHLLHILFKINRDLVFNFLRKEEIGKRSHKVCQIQKRHKSAKILHEKGGIDIQVIGSDTWKVQSESTSDQYYNIEKVTTSLECDCHLRCVTCGVCVHNFSCSCIDALLHNTICKHVHLLCLQHPELDKASTDAGMSPAEHTTTVATQITSAGPGSVAPCASGIISKEAVLKKIDELKDLVSKSSATNFSEVNSHMTSAIAIMQNKDLRQFDIRKRPAPNANNVTQENFYSTKKKRKVTSKHITKPTNTEHISVRSQLSDVKILVCGICYNTDDNCQNETGIEWVECSKCSLWVHQLCAKRAIRSSVIDIENFMCNACVNSI